jgi:hypothetical protein
MRSIHGHTRQGKRSPTHQSWTSMMRRCFSPNHNRYYLYGAKGVTVCERWRTFANFLEDMGERPEGCTLGRHNDQGNYEPGNVNWQTSQEQAKRGERNGMAKLTQEQADCIRSLHQSGQNHPRKKWLVNGSNISKDLGISPAQVSSVINWRSYA